MNNSTILSCRGLQKRFRQGDQDLLILKNIQFTLEQGQSAAILGSSGSGKSTLLQLLGGLDMPSAGHIEVMGQDLTRLKDAARGRLRNRYLGFIYQFHHLLGEFSALENVAIPLLIRGLKTQEATLQATRLLEDVGLGHRLHHKPGKLSGGERQRTAIARALITQPACILADEPTGNLDHQTAEQVFQLMLKLNQSLKTGLIIVTHDETLASRMDTIWRLVDGELRQE